MHKDKPKCLDAINDLKINYIGLSYNIDNH